MEKINLTALFEQIFGTSEITDRNQLLLLIEALREMPDEPLFTPESIKELKERIESKREEGEEREEKE